VPRRDAGARRATAHRRVVAATRIEIVAAPIIFEAKRGAAFKLILVVEVDQFGVVAHAVAFVRAESSLINVVVVDNARLRARARRRRHR
jgi:hypothetical protein